MGGADPIKYWRSAFRAARRAGLEAHEERSRDRHSEEVQERDVWQGETQAFGDFAENELRATPHKNFR